MHNLPTLLVNVDVCKANIKRMAEKAANGKVAFRPHFKTHQSIEIGRWFKEVGVKSITVSSVEMADYFAADGWNDITVAFPLVPGSIDKVNDLAQKVSLNITVSSAKNLLASIDKLTAPLGIFIEVDVGHHRTGVAPDNMREIALMVSQLASKPNLTFKGFLAHAGHSYSAKGADEVNTIYNTGVSQLVKLKSFWRETYPNIIISWGDTPTCSLIDEFWGIDEIRPGNFVFYDLTQSNIGSCNIQDIAVALICPIVDINTQRSEVAIHGGAIHLSKDTLTNANNETVYGMVCNFNGKKWGTPIDEAYIKSVSQEHGIVKFNNEIPLQNLRVGDLLAVLPVHSCLTLDTMGLLSTPAGKTIETFRTRKY